MDGLPSGRGGIELREVDLARSAPIHLGEPEWRVVYRLSERPTDEWIQLFITLRPTAGPAARAYIDGANVVVDAPGGPPWSQIRDELRIAVSATNESWRDALFAARRGGG